MEVGDTSTDTVSEFVGEIEKTTTDPSACTNDGDGSQMSKRQKKRLLKHQQWLVRKEEMRKTRSVRRKELKVKKAKTGERPAKIYKMADKEASQVKVVIDCNFDDLMSEKDIRQLVKQIQRSYADNRRSPSPLQFYLCSVSGKTLNKLEECASGYQNWDVYVKSEKPLEVFDKDNIVYLTSDSPNILETLESNKAYIIGGLVDHNHYKGLCYQRAIEAGIAHAQLPISDYVKLKSRNVMTVNHVFEILLRYTQFKDWKKAFYHVIPQRKRASDDEEEESTTTLSKVVDGETNDTAEVNDMEETRNSEETENTDADNPETNNTAETSNTEEADNTETMNTAEINDTPEVRDQKCKEGSMAECEDNEIDRVKDEGENK
ncbi:uncharacterized protein LOC144452339 [Glandiceps talaboti]